ncbi:helix-turn-helix transcriptional regulator [Buttiauxella gaviniae]|uniref:helix-turn-helix transcriptional regulator n=1 Tax=Buttiauxella gaviniae TaxID=82990 RepID=UPI00397685A0
MAAMQSIIQKEELKYVPDLDRMVREAECKYLTGLSHSGRWKAEKEGRFPKRVKIGLASVAWRLSEIQAWIRGEWHPNWKSGQA